MLEKFFMQHSWILDLDKCVVPNMMDWNYNGHCDLEYPIRDNDKFQTLGAY